MSGGYWLLIIVSTVLGVLSQGFIQRTYARWAQVPVSTGETGEQVSRRMLAQFGATSVGITSVAGRLTDHYDPRDNNLHLSQENRMGGSVASVAVACHEAGHAVQNSIGYVPLQIRSAMVPVTNLASQSWMIAFYAGIMFNMLGVVKIAVVLFAVTLAFQLITLPVEFDASNRALSFIRDSAGLDQQAFEGARKVLFAAALTYVAAALTSSLQFLWMLGQVRDDR